MKFKILSGIHRVGKKNYIKGMVVESGVKLDKKFPNKFERIMEFTPEHPDGISNEDGDKKVSPPEYEAKHKGAGKWIVINKNSHEEKQINEGYLKKDEAQQMVADMNQGQ